jgi:hypothetical protein
MKHFIKQHKGFTIFFATLVASLALAIGLAIYDITFRQLDLSLTVVQSEYAIYAADTGAECALYWDAHYTSSTNSSAFATSSTSGYPTSGIVCGTFDVAAHGTPPATYVAQDATWTQWAVTSNANAATTTFTLTFPNYSYCEKVEVAKYANGSGSVSTTILSHGYNTCITGSKIQLERELKVSY